MRQSRVNFLLGGLTLGFVTLMWGALPKNIAKVSATAPKNISLSEIVEAIPSLPLTPSLPLILSPPSPMPEPENPLPLEPISAKMTVAEEKPLFPRVFLDEVAEAKKVPWVPYHPLPLLTPVKKRPNSIVGLRPEVEFWRNIFAQYTKPHTILHDQYNLGILYGVLDFTPLYKNPNLDNAEIYRVRKFVEEEKKESLRQLLARFDAGEGPQTEEEKRINFLLEGFEDPEKFKKAQEGLRAQWGQKDRFEEGLVRFGRYKKMLEAIFAHEGVPAEVTALTFVESMFTLGALSKVGASGPWQFMRETGKNFLKINAEVDERLDPLLAGQAAAKLLRKNYELLKSWPLAINAYNTGPLRMLRAVKQLETRDIATIIHHFEDRGYQFASRNFYPEFLAADEILSNHQKYFGSLDLDSPVPFDWLILPQPLSFYELATVTATDISIFKDLNPSFFSQNFAEGVYISSGSVIRIPHRQKDLYLAELKEIREREKNIRWHRIDRRDNFQRIAARYQIPLPLLKKANNGMPNLREGQLLKIPGTPEPIVLGPR